MRHDGTIDISVGRSREEKRWQNKEVQWSWLVKKCTAVHRTAETYETYMKEKPSRQDVIKDIGGFVGGVIAGGRRKNGSIVSRRVLTLDLDFAESAEEMWSTVEMLGHAACGYSTHKHRSEAPRLRLVMPLDRDVLPTEYEAIARKVASWFDIEWFDPTTFQPTRLMYWPSASKDGEFWSAAQDGPWLAADEVLGQYHDWQDESQWPLSSKAKEKLRAGLDKQEDPLGKTGLVGAFNRTYSISEAIKKFLSETYAESLDGSGRYTYIKGSTANGLVVYDDVFAYSHHGTDPISEKLCNAWDLVRLHRFGHLDEKAEAGGKGAKMPSFVAMSDFVSEDRQVLRTIGEEKLAEARDVFYSPGEDADDSPPAGGEEAGDGELWMERMEVDNKGHYTQTINNALLVLENDPGLKGCFGWDDFSHRPVCRRDLPWRAVTKYDKYLRDDDLSAIRHYMELIYGLTGREKIEDALVIVMRKNVFHPVREWLDKLVWDGTPRAERLFIDYLGVEPTQYSRTVTRKSLTACVARVYDPGCKFDELIVLVGAQGIGKSTILRKMAGAWFSDSIIDISKKDALEQLAGAWIVEFGELASLRRAESDQFKHFVAKQEDIFRWSFGRLTNIYPRQCVFFGTVNVDDFLKDTSGNRRFWPLVTDEAKSYKSVFNDLTAEVVKQVWAEVVGWYLMGEDLYLDKDVAKEAKRVQAEHMATDERVALVRAYLDREVPAKWDNMSIYERRAWLDADDDIEERGVAVRDEISVAEIWCEVMRGSMRELNVGMSRELHNLMRRIGGWTYSKKQKRLGVAYGRQMMWKRDAVKKNVIDAHQ